MWTEMVDMKRPELLTTERVRRVMQVSHSVYTEAGPLAMDETLQCAECEHDVPIVDLVSAVHGGCEDLVCTACTGDLYHECRGCHALVHDDDVSYRRGYGYECKQCKSARIAQRGAAYDDWCDRQYKESRLGL